MKVTITAIISIFILLQINTTSAQIGGYGRGGYGGMGGGMNRNSVMNASAGSSRHAEETKENEEENTKKVVAKLKTTLHLDELQVIAIQNIITDTKKSQGLIMKKETDDALKVKDLEVLSETQDRKILEMLYKDQKVQYLEMAEERKSKNELESRRRR